MTITTVETYEGSETKSLRFTTDDGKEVIISRSRISWTVVYNPTRRSLGKTFFSADEMMAHYKSIRSELVVAMQELNNA